MKVTKIAQSKENNFTLPEVQIVKKIEVNHFLPEMLINEIDSH